ncbi:hypothetical protein N7G274_003510 [Stereocaulon virgatum]|uniref:Rab-GAP TBC domain-containing protein n=1 Tax=Stereocaulon virgatum TaxID=373712 RepID=A0ABR4AEW7_9LECA
MNFDFLLHEPTPLDHSGPDSFVKEEWAGRVMAQSSEQTTPDTRVNGLTIPEESAHNSPIGLNCRGLRHSASTGQVRQTERPIVHHTPTYPTLPRRSKTGLRMPSAFSSPMRGRGSSVSASSPHQSPLPPQLSTAVNGSNSRPTGKRRPNGITNGENGVNDSFPAVGGVPSIPPWSRQGYYSNDEVRSSFRSAVTSNSSPIDRTSTERSSVLTKCTSMTDSTFDIHSRPGSKVVEGMTVDEAIDMYAAGFYDDDDPCLDRSRDTSMSEEERRRSMRIAEAINDNIGWPTKLHSTTKESPRPDAVTSGNAFKDAFQQPPPLMPPTSTRDQYGFMKSNHHISLPQYDAWYQDYQPSQERRRKKWTAYTREQHLPTYLPTRFPSPSAKTERYIRKGIPPAWRGPAWFFYAGGQAYLDRHPGLYKSLISKSETSLSSNDKEAIERDLHRTFPDNIHFKPDSHLSEPSVSESPLLASLRRVLRAFALHSPRIGYCQSLNFLTGLLLLFLPEEKAFWMLHIITTVYLPGTHDVSLEGANVDLWVLMVALKSTMPNIWTKVGNAGTPGDDLIGNSRLPPISLCTTSWFMSLFIGTLPIESVLRVWDILFYEGSRTLFRVALTIFKLGEQRIKDVTDSMELFQVVQGLPRGMIDASAFITTMNRRPGVSREWVETRRRERRAWYTQERMKPSNTADIISKDEYFAQNGGEEIKRKDSIWKRGKRKGSVPEGKLGVAVPVPVPRDGIAGVRRELLVL